MENRIRPVPMDRRDDGPHPIGEVLAELLAQYQIRFPDVEIAVVETAAA